MSGQIKQSGCVRFRRGRWELDFRDALGRRHQEACNDLRKDETRLRREAESRLYKRLEEVGLGRYQAPSERLTVAELVERFLTNVEATQVRASTVLEYRRQAIRHILPRLGTLIARDVRPVQIEAWRNNLLKTPKVMPNRSPKRPPPTAEEATRLPRMVTARTVSKLMQLLSSIFRYGLRYEWVLRNPCDGVARPRRPREAHQALVEGNALSGVECRRLLECCEPRWRLPIEMALLTGMREGELLALSWDDVDWQSNKVMVRRTRRAGEFHAPKTATSYRLVRFPGALTLELKKWRLACPKGEHNLLFPNTQGNPENAQNLLHRGLYPALRRAGLRRIRFHDLRHTYASLQLAAGQNLAVVSRQLGHADSSITLKVYRHVLPDEADGLGEQIHETIFGGDLVANAEIAKRETA